jgi:colanic acid/amylovoran biosynthesis glycosyltransferase
MTSPKTTIHLFSRNYPFGRGESFIEEEVRRLQRYGHVIVVPAFRDRSSPRLLPGGAELETSLAERRMSAGMKSPSAIASTLSKLPGEILDRGAASLRPRSQFSIWAYLVRVARFTDWILKSTEGRRVRNAMSFWSNAEAVGLAVAGIHRSDLRFVSRSHRFDVWEEHNPYGYLPFRSLLASRATYLLPSSSRAAEHLRGTVDGAARVVVAPLGVDRPLEPSDGRCDPTDRGPVVLTCSSAANVKRLGLVARSLARAAESDPTRSWTWIHLGDGADQIREELGDVPSNLTTELPGPVPRIEVFRCHRDRRPDAFVNLSSSEGVPLTIMEAMSMGTPVVATAAGGPGEIVDSDVGALLPVDIDCATAAASIRRVVDDSELFRTAAIKRWQTAASAKVAESVLEVVIPELMSDR